MKRFYSRSGIDSLLVTVMGILICLSLGSVGKAVAQTERDEHLRLLTASGEAEVKMRPDLGVVRLGVETEAPTAAEAGRQNASRAVKIVDALKSLGIPESAMETSVFEIEPVRRFETEDQRGEPPIVAYRVTNIIGVRTEKLDLVPGIIDGSVNAGANRVESVDFILRDEDAPKQTALLLAVANARRNAETMAKELGVTLVSVQSVQQGGVGVAQPPMYIRGMAEAAPPTPIFPGELSVSASATLTYLIR